MKMTIFNSNSNSKLALSPYNDNTFDFNTIETSFNELPKYFAYNFHLNRCYEIKNKRLERTKRALHSYLCENIEYIILDFDKIHNYNNVERIIEILKEKDYYFFLMPSRSYGKDSYNLKGAVKVKGYNNEKGIIQFLNKLQNQLNGYCEIDSVVAREAMV
jgi:glucose-6-phosphate 1-dehydrogenase